MFDRRVCTRLSSEPESSARRWAPVRTATRLLTGQLEWQQSAQGCRSGVRCFVQMVSRDDCRDFGSGEDRKGCWNAAKASQRLYALRVDAVELRRPEQTVDRSRTFSACIGTREQVVLTATATVCSARSAALFHLPAPVIDRHAESRPAMKGALMPAIPAVRAYTEPCDGCERLVQQPVRRCEAAAEIERFRHHARWARNDTSFRARYHRRRNRLNMVG